MTDIPSARKKIQLEETKYKGAISEGTAQKIGAAVNSIIDDGTFMLGDILYSALSEASFQSRRGNSWVKMTGQSIVGSDLAIEELITVLPDLVGNEAHLAQANVEGELGNYQASQNKAHTHDAFGGIGIPGGLPVFSLQDDTSAVDGGVSTQSEGGSVARPNRYMQNIFIKIWNENQ